MNRWVLLSITFHLSLWTSPLQYQDLKKVMSVFAMEPHWTDRAEDKTEKAIKQVTYEGETTRVLKSGYGFRPERKDVSDAVVVKVPLAHEQYNVITVGELPERITTMEQSAVEELAAKAVESCGLGVDVNIVMVQHGYTELFDRELLEKMREATVRRHDGEDYNVAFRDRYGLKNDATGGDGSMQKLLRVIAAFMAMPHDNGVGSNNVAYHYKFGDQLARRYASSASFQNITGGLRKTLAAKFYWDLDFENSYPTILTHTFAGRGGELARIPVFARYCRSEQQWEACLTQIMAFYDVSRKAAKSCFLAHCHGGQMDGRRWTDADGREQRTGWMNEWDVCDEVRVKASRQGHLQLVRDFARECAVVCALLTGQYPEFKGTLVQVNQRLPANKRKTDRMGLPDAVLREAETYLAAQTLRGGVSIPMKLSEKPLRSPYGLGPAGDDDGDDGDGGDEEVV